MARSSADPTGDLGFRPVKRALVIEHDEHGPAEGAGDHLVERGYQPIFEFSVVRPPRQATCPITRRPPEVRTYERGAGVALLIASR